MTKVSKADPTPRAVTGFRAMRKRLAQENPGFAEAERLEAEADEFCGSIRGKLRRCRKIEGIDQKELGEVMQLTQSAVSRIENGTGDIGLKSVYRFARALGYQPVVMFTPSVEGIIAGAIAGDQNIAAASTEIHQFAAEFNSGQTKMMQVFSDEMTELLTRAVTVAGHVRDQ